MVQQNGYFVQQEHGLIAMLGDDNENKRNEEVVKMLERWKQVVEESANNDDCSLALNSSLIRLFDVPTLCLRRIRQFCFVPAKASNSCKPCRCRNRRVSEGTSGIAPPTCHSQSVERHVKFVAEASAQVERFDSTKKFNLAKLRKRLTSKSNSNKVL